MRVHVSAICGICLSALRLSPLWLGHFLAVFAFSAAVLSGECTTQYGGPPAEDHELPEYLPLVLTINFNLSPGQTNPYTPGSLQIVTHVSTITYWAGYKTGDPKHPFRYVSTSNTEAQKMYDRDCPGGPYMSFPPQVPENPHISRSGAESRASAPAYGRASTVMAFADFNQDGNFDVAGLNSTSVTVVLQDDAATALSVKTYKINGSPATLIAADVNGDGFPDIVVADGGDPYTGSNGGLWVLLNNKDGTFASPVEYPAGVEPTFLFAADFNGDGKLDLVASDSGAATIVVLLGNGDGTFQAAVSMPAGRFSDVVVSADFNNDGKADLAVTDSAANNLLIFFGNGDGTFQQPHSFRSGPGYGDLIFGDFNNDGFTDLIASFASGNQAIVFLNNGSGGFTASPPYLLGGYPTVLEFSPPGAAAGFVLLSTDNVNLLPVVVSGNSNGTLNAPQLLATKGSQATAIAAADVNGDGREDVVQTDKGLLIASVFLNAAGGTFESPATYSLLTSGDQQPTLAAAGLFGLRSGAKPDLVVADEGLFNPPGGLIVLPNAGNGTFGTARMVAAGADPIGVVAADFNGDGKLDLAVGDAWAQAQGSASAAVSVLFGDGQGNFAAPISYVAGQSAVAIATEDFNGDGKPDLVVGLGNPTSTATSIVVLLNQGSGTFSALAPVTAPQGLAQIAAADFNGDGKIDLALIGSTIQILLGNGDGTFNVGQSAATETGANSVALADMDGNGTLDLVVGHCCGIADDTTLLGKGDGTFQTEVHFLSGPYPTAVVVGDWNGDGIPDVAVADAGVGEMLPLLNWFGPTIVSGASFQSVPIAPESIATALGRHLATSTAANQATAPPTSLGGTTVQLTDILGNKASALLFFVSAHQVNFEVPAGLAPGPGLATITASDGTVSSSSFLIQPYSPGVFVLDSAGLAAADLIQVSGSKQTAVPVYKVVNGAIEPNPINLLASPNQNILILFGTGFRGADPSTIKVTFNGIAGTLMYAGAQGTFGGLDQANIEIPQNAGLHGDVVVAFEAGGTAANQVHLTFQ